MAWMTSALLLHACMIPLLFTITFVFKQNRTGSRLFLKCLVLDKVLAEMLFDLVHLQSLELGCSMRRHWKKGCGKA